MSKMSQNNQPFVYDRTISTCKKESYVLFNGTKHTEREITR